MPVKNPKEMFATILSHVRHGHGTVGSDLQGAGRIGAESGNTLCTRRTGFRVPAIPSEARRGLQPDRGEAGECHRTAP
jgi:hypothetical protein